MVPEPWETDDVDRVNDPMSSHYFRGHWYAEPSCRGKLIMIVENRREAFNKL